MRLKVVAVLAAALWPGFALAAPDAGELWASLQAQMKDPGSSYYRSTSYAELYKDGKLAGVSLCGEVNAKNSYGGYTGFQPFFVNWIGSTGKIWSDTGKAALILIPPLCGTDPAPGIKPQVKNLPDMVQPQ